MQSLKFLQPKTASLYSVMIANPVDDDDDMLLIDALQSHTNSIKSPGSSISNGSASNGSAHESDLMDMDLDEKEVELFAMPALSDTEEFFNNE